MTILVVSKDEMEKLRDDQERHELEELRAAVRLASIQDAKDRLDEIQINCDKALHIAEEAYLRLDDDDDDNFDARESKADELAKIERQHDRCIAIWKNQIRRMNWEARQAQK